MRVGDFTVTNVTNRIDLSDGTLLASGDVTITESSIVTGTIIATNGGSVTTLGNQASTLGSLEDLTVKVKTLVWNASTALFTSASSIDNKTGFAGAQKAKQAFDGVPSAGFTFAGSNVFDDIFSGGSATNSATVRHQSIWDA